MNTSLLHEIKEIMASGDTIPQAVMIRLVLSGLIQMGATLEAIDDQLNATKADLVKSRTELSEYRTSYQVERKAQSENIGKTLQGIVDLEKNIDLIEHQVSMLEHDHKKLVIALDAASHVASNPAIVAGNLLLTKPKLFLSLLVIVILLANLLGGILLEWFGVPLSIVNLLKGALHLP